MYFFLTCLELFVRVLIFDTKLRKDFLICAIEMVGGVFLIPYFIFMALVGIPLVFLELGVGQFMSSGKIIFLF